MCGPRRRSDEDVSQGTDAEGRQGRRAAAERLSTSATSCAMDSSRRDGDAAASRRPSMSVCRPSRSSRRTRTIEVSRCSFCATLPAARSAATSCGDIPPNVSTSSGTHRRSPPFELDHRVVSVHGSAARRKPHSRHPEPLELAGKRRCVTFCGRGGSVCSRERLTWYPRESAERAFTGLDVRHRLHRVVC